MMDSTRTALAALLLVHATSVCGQAEGGKRVVLTSGKSWPERRGGSRAVLNSPGVNGALFLRGPTRNVRIRGVVVQAAYRALEMRPGAYATDLVVDGLEASVTRECIRLRGDDVVIRNVHCRMTGPPQTSMKHLPEGIHIQAGNRILLEKSSFNGFRMQRAKDVYWNGDGVVVEGAVTDIEIRDVSADDNTDSGFDIKPPVRMDRVSASGNCRNFRFRSDADVGTLTVGNTVKRGGKTSCSGIWIKGAPPSATKPVIRIRKLIVRMTSAATVISIEEGTADIHIGECDIRAPEGSRFIHAKIKGGVLKLGEGCNLGDARP
jgi:hypothetical protein